MAERAAIAFLGLGTMGTAMVRRLLRAGLRTTVYNRARAPAEALAAEGACVASSPREAAREADVVFAMLSDDAASRAVWEGEHGALSGARRGALAIESSTLSAPRARALEQLASDRGIDFLEAPVMGSRDQAASGELVFLAGGEASHVERARPVLAHLGRSLQHVGPSGAGATLKLVANALLGAQIASLAEAFAFLEMSGLALEPALAALTSGSAASPVVRAIAPRLLARDHQPRFALSLLVKDLGHALAEARARGVEQPVTEAAYRLFARGVERGLGPEDVSSVAKLWSSSQR
jgi:3-hydroxyisobutyrate dehydrogenase